MKVFHCCCGQEIFFENTTCVACSRELGWCSACHDLISLDEAGRCPHDGCNQALVSCVNRTEYGVCNGFALPEASEGLCQWCARTTHFPDLSVSANSQRWRDLERAKRRLLFELDLLGIDEDFSSADPPLTFQFLQSSKEVPVLTGHAAGVITIEVNEADSVHRERIRRKMGEPQRTLIGHMRHEVSHYLCLRLADNGASPDCVQVFGDPNAVEYADALAQYYETGPAADWQENFVSEYASSHPWEDFAETCGLYLDLRAVLGTLAARNAIEKPNEQDAAALVRAYVKCGVLLNEVNRSMGLTDLVPEVIAPPVICKLEYIHDLLNL